MTAHVSKYSLTSHETETRGHAAADDATLPHCRQYDMPQQPTSSARSWSLCQGCRGDVLACLPEVMFPAVPLALWFKLRWSIVLVFQLSLQSC